MRKIKFLGIPVSVVDEDDINAERESQAPHNYMVRRVADADLSFASPDLRARVTRSPCEKCREICYVDPKCFDEFRGMNLTIICLQCLRAEAQSQP